MLGKARKHTELEGMPLSRRDSTQCEWCVDHGIRACFMTFGIAIGVRTMIVVVSEKLVREEVRVLNE